MSIHKPVDNRQFETAVRDPRPTELKRILPNVIKVDAPLTGGSSALMVAAQLGSAEKVKMLIDAGADPCFVQSPQMYTPIMLIAQCRLSDEESAECLKLMLGSVPFEKHEVVVNMKDRFHSTALMLAAQNKKPNVVKKLLRHGARVDDTNNFGRSALYLAVSSRLVVTCKILREAGADIHLADNKGITPLMRAETIGSPQLTELLQTTELRKNSTLTRTDSTSQMSLGNVSAKVDSGLRGTRPNLEASETPIIKTKSSDKCPERKQESNRSLSWNHVGAKIDTGLHGSRSSLEERVNSPKEMTYNNNVLSASVLQNGPVFCSKDKTLVARSNSLNLNGETLQINSESTDCTQRLDKSGDVICYQSNVTSEALDSLKSRQENMHQNSRDEQSVEINNEVLTISQNSNENGLLNGVTSESKNGSPINLSDHVGDEIKTDNNQQNKEVSAAIPVNTDAEAYGLATSSVTPMDDLEVFLGGMDLSTLLPVFRSNKIGLQEVMCLNEEDLEKMGIAISLHRKKLLEGIRLFVMTPFDNKSLPSVYEPGLKCKDFIHVTSNVACHLSWLVGSVAYARRQMCNLPQLALSTQHDPNQNLETLNSFVEDSIFRCQQLCDHLEKMKINVEQIKEKSEILPSFVASTDKERRRKSNESPNKSSLTLWTGFSFVAATVGCVVAYYKFGFPFKQIDRLSSASKK